MAERASGHSVQTIEGAYHIFLKRAGFDGVKVTTYANVGDSGEIAPSPSGNIVLATAYKPTASGEKAPA